MNWAHEKTGVGRKREDYKRSFLYGDWEHRHCPVDKEIL